MNQATINKLRRTSESRLPPTALDVLINWKTNQGRLDWCSLRAIRGCGFDLWGLYPVEIIHWSPDSGLLSNRSDIDGIPELKRKEKKKQASPDGARQIWGRKCGPMTNRNWRWMPIMSKSIRFMQSVWCRHIPADVSSQCLPLNI